MLAVVPRLGTVVSTSAPVTGSKPSETSVRTPPGVPIEPPSATIDVALARPTAKERPVSGKGELTLVQIVGWHEAEPGSEV